MKSSVDECGCRDGRMRCPYCPYCNAAAELVGGAVIYPHRPDLHYLKFWLCAPCQAYVGCHDSGKGRTPLGTLANAELRAARSRAHAVFDPIWRSRKRTREGAYAWLAHRMGIEKKDAHIGMFGLEQCHMVIELAKTHR